MFSSFSGRHQILEENYYKLVCQDSFKDFQNGSCVNIGKTTNQTSFVIY